ncbi:MAG: polyprenyl synthetase family protein [Actinomycetia bacterium]|nr:polyprenyl synthetase family protein [Actinomycetes bacterium]
MTGAEWLEQAAAWVDPALEAAFPPPDTPPAPLYAAIRYALLGPGKRFRPALVFGAARWLGVPPESMLAPAMAVEMIHAYSLVHDDLPAMDNDDLRRGRPTVHRAFAEDVAILVGDALLTEAFGRLAAHPGPPRGVVRAVARLAEAAGHAGLVGGQMRDLRFSAADGADALEALHRAKTGALISCAAELPAWLLEDDRAVRSLSIYGQAVGLAFQITDDILDVVGDGRVMGKAAGRDARQGKTTYVSLYGVETARRMAVRETERALDAVPGASGDALRAVARFVLERDR